MWELDVRVRLERKDIDTVHFKVQVKHVALLKCWFCYTYIRVIFKFESQNQSWIMNDNTSQIILSKGVSINNKLVLLVGWFSIVKLMFMQICETNNVQIFLLFFSKNLNLCKSLRDYIASLYLWKPLLVYIFFIKSNFLFSNCPINIFREFFNLTNILSMHKSIIKNNNKWSYGVHFKQCKE